MKTITIVLSTLLTFGFAFASIDVNVKYGQSGAQVTELQEFLSDKGYLTVSPSGFFGLKTLSAVKSYQLDRGISSTGYVGQLTRSAINQDISVDLASSTEAEVAETGTTTPVTPVLVTQPVPTVSTGGYTEPRFTPPTIQVSKKAVSFEHCSSIQKVDGKFLCSVDPIIFNDLGQAWANLPIRVSYIDNNGNTVTVDNTNAEANLYFDEAGTYSVTVEVPSLGLSKTVSILIQ